MLLAALISDLRTSKIKNTIVFPFILLGVITNFWQNGYEGLVLALRGSFLPLVLLFIFFILSTLGAGDIKLFCAIGAIKGSDFVLDTIIYSYLAGGVLAFLIMLARRNSTEGFKYLFTYLKHCLLTRSLKSYADCGERSHNGKFPFTSAVAGGVLLKILFDYLPR